MNIHMTPSLLGFILTCIALVYIKKKNSNSNSKIFHMMVLAFAVHHAFEVMLFIQYFKEAPTIMLLRIYHVLSITCLALIMHYCMEVTKTNNLPRTITTLIICLVVNALIMFNNDLISGSQELGYSSTAIKGPLYAVFQVTATSLLLLTLVILIMGYKKSVLPLSQIQCLYVLLAFLPLILGSILIIVFMAAGYRVNATMITPITFSIFLFMTIKNEQQHRLTDLRRFMPFSQERKTSQEIMELYSKYAKDEILYRDCINEVEKILVLQKYKNNNNNASAAAEVMGMPRSSLYSIFNRLSIDLKNK